MHMRAFTTFVRSGTSLESLKLAWTRTPRLLSASCSQPALALMAHISQGQGFGLLASLPVDISLFKLSTPPSISICAIRLRLAFLDRAC